MTLLRTRIVVAFAVGLPALALLGPRARAKGDVGPVDVPAEVDSFIRATEASVPGIRAGDQKRIVWASPASPSTTGLAVVYLHGFSADPHELDPVPQRLADSLGANLFITRLAGHGLETGAGLADVTAGDWLRDTEEALAIGGRLGRKVVLIGTSTGGTLAVWAAAESRRKDELAALMLVSPNFGPRDPNARLLLWPWGGLLARMVVGEERCWSPVNAAQERHWTTCYPTRALLPMMALVDLVRRTDPSRVTVPTLVLFSPEDQVVDPDETRRYVSRFGSAVHELVEFAGEGDPSHHVLGGDIVSPETTDRVVAEMLAFVRRRVSPPEQSP
jgi:alpha-beta hydrolase superfamily lysophospholipase